MTTAIRGWQSWTRIGRFLLSVLEFGDAWTELNCTFEISRRSTKGEMLSSDVTEKIFLTHATSQSQISSIPDGNRLKIVNDLFVEKWKTNFFAKATDHAKRETNDADRLLENEFEGFTDHLCRDCVWRYDSFPFPTQRSMLAIPPIERHFDVSSNLLTVHPHPDRTARPTLSLWVLRSEAICFFLPQQGCCMRCCRDATLLDRERRTRGHYRYYHPRRWNRDIAPFWSSFLDSVAARPDWRQSTSGLITAVATKKSEEITLTKFQCRSEFNSVSACNPTRTGKYLLIQHISDLSVDRRAVWIHPRRRPRSGDRSVRWLAGLDRPVQREHSSRFHRRREWLVSDVHIHGSVEEHLCLFVYSHDKEKGCCWRVVVLRFAVDWEMLWRDFEKWNWIPVRSTRPRVAPKQCVARKNEGTE